MGAPKPLLFLKELLSSWEHTVLTHETLNMGVIDKKALIH